MQPLGIFGLPQKAGDESAGSSCFHAAADGSELAFGQGVELEIAALVPQPGVGDTSACPGGWAWGKSSAQRVRSIRHHLADARGGAPAKCRRATRPWRSMSRSARQWRTRTAQQLTVCRCAAGLWLKVAGSVLAVVARVAAASLLGAGGAGPAAVSRLGILLSWPAVGAWGGGDLQAARAAMALASSQRNQLVRLPLARVARWGGMDGMLVGVRQLEHNGW